MQSLYVKLKEANSIVIASPIYWFNLSAQIKIFIDRCYAFGVGSKNIFYGKNFAILLSYADSDPFNSGASNVLRIFQDICQYLHTNIAGMVYGSADKPGEITMNQNVMDQAYKLGDKLGSVPSGDQR
jgi:multimeric flavodoxin WrbA